MKELTFEAVQACKNEKEFWALLTEDCGWAGPQAYDYLDEQNDELSAELERLKELLNTPETKEFFKGVKYEAGHQRWRWGDDHDMRKTAGEWFWTLGYLAQKCMQACEAGDAEKAQHHTISSGALLANWHRHIRKGGGGVR